MSSSTHEGDAPIRRLARRNDFEAIFHSSPDSILLVGGDGSIHDANPRAEAMFGWLRDEMVGQPVEILVPQALRDAHRRHRTVYGSNPVSRPMGLGMELEAVRKDGVAFPVEISLGPSRDHSGNLLVVCVVRDLTQSQVLRRVAAARVLAVESERKRIAGELHDEVKQGLTATQLHLAALVQMKVSPNDAAEMVLGVQRDLDRCQGALDRAIRDLMPVELERWGLGFALRILCRRAGDDEFCVEQDIRPTGGALSAEARLAVFRIVQEAINNAKRHSGAGSATVRYWREGRVVRVVVADSGCGFSPDALDPRRSVGLASMRERSRIVGGRLTVASAPGDGTSVRLEMRISLPRPGEEDPQ